VKAAPFRFRVQPTEAIVHQDNLLPGVDGSSHGLSGNTY
jgi:hypothetical protein